MFECQFRNVTAEAHPTFCFGTIDVQLWYFLNITGSTAELMDQFGSAANKRRVVTAPVGMAVGRWHSLRVVFEGDRRRFWIHCKLLIDVKDPLDLKGYCPGINTWNGAGVFRNLRIRELK